MQIIILVSIIFFKSCEGFHFIFVAPYFSLNFITQDTSHIICILFIIITFHFNLKLPVGEEKQNT